MLMIYRDEVCVATISVKVTYSLRHFYKRVVQLYIFYKSYSILASPKGKPKYKGKVNFVNISEQKQLARRMV